MRNWAGLGDVGDGNVGDVGDVGNVGRGVSLVPNGGVIARQGAPAANPEFVLLDQGKEDFKLLAPAGQGFPGAYWDPELLAVRVLNELTADPNWWGKVDACSPGDWKEMRVSDAGAAAAAAATAAGADAAAAAAAAKAAAATPAAHAAADAAEIGRLIFLADTQRALRHGEITAQAVSGFAPAYWVTSLMLSSTSHPATIALLHVGVGVGRAVAMHFKAKYHRPRPMQVYPALMPAIVSPGHPSYPNAHMLQSRLISILIAMAEQGVKKIADGPSVIDQLNVENDRELRRWPFMEQLARRIGQNREIAGLHFPSDTTAGELIADRLADLLGESKLLQQLLDRAMKELGNPAFPSLPQPEDDGGQTQQDPEQATDSQIPAENKS